MEIGTEWHKNLRNCGSEVDSWELLFQTPLILRIQNTVYKEQSAGGFGKIAGLFRRKSIF